MFFNKKIILWLKFIFILILKIRNINGIDYQVELKGLGKIIGSNITTEWSKENIIQFLGIPYGVSPKKANKRFEVAEPIEWSNTQRATTYGRRCPDPNVPKSFESKNDDIEDCLNLNVYTKNLSAPLKPVMVYIFDNNPSRNISDFAPVYLMDKKNIVFVSISYRTGILGFAAYENTQIPGNVGVSDVYTALSWVKHYIQYFGGNPNEITIFGEPTIVGTLTSNIATKDLFKRAIIQSAFYNGLKNNTKNEIDKICEKIKCPNTGEDSKIQYLKDINIHDLMKFSKHYTFTLTKFDKLDIITSPTEMLKKLKNKHSIMMGITKNDGISSKETDILKKINNANELSTLVKEIYGFNVTSFISEQDFKENKIFNILAGIINIFNMGTDKYYRNPLLQFIKTYRLGSAPDLYLYSFDYVGANTTLKLPSEYKNFTMLIPKPVHNDELIYLFKLFDLSKSIQDTNMAKKMVDIWTSFAIGGKPKVDGDNKINITRMENDVGPYFHIDQTINVDKNFTREYIQQQNGGIQGNVFGMQTTLRPNGNGGTSQKPKSKKSSGSKKLFQNNYFYVFITIIIVVAMSTGHL